jgi:hypothetical protein
MRLPAVPASALPLEPKKLAKERGLVRDVRGPSSSGVLAESDELAIHGPNGGEGVDPVPALRTRYSSWRNDGLAFLAELGQGLALLPFAIAGGFTLLAVVETALPDVGHHAETQTVAGVIEQRAVLLDSAASRVLPAPVGN